MTNGAVSFLKLPTRDDPVRLLLLDPNDVERLDRDHCLDLDSKLDSGLDSEPELDADSSDPLVREVRPVAVDRPELVVRPDLGVPSDLEEMEETSELRLPDDSSEMEDILVFEVISDTDDRSLVDSFFSGSAVA